MFERLERLKAELKRNMDKRAEIDEKIKDIERRITEEEKSSIHEYLKAEKMTPEELVRLISFAKNNPPMSKPLNRITKEEEDEDEE